MGWTFAVAITVAFFATVTALCRMLASQQRAHARREDLLLNQLLAATGRPWQLPPAEEARMTDRLNGRKRVAYAASPEQYPSE
jgi:hypothetical protein